MGDFTKIRNIHAGAFEQHIFHLHNHQWLFNPNDDNANYLDAQEIMPGSGHTYELANGGVGNRNKTAGDAIFHCHFYPHFAQGMWYHIRIQDTFEKGSKLVVSGTDFHANRWDLRSGQPAAGTRALPDGELPDGVPIPAIVPLPGKAMPPMPANVSIAAVDRGGFSLLGGRTGPDGIPDSGQAVVDRVSVAGPDGILRDNPATPDVDESADDRTPGFPFWIAGNECGVPLRDEEGNVIEPCPQGIVGQRSTTPPLDMLTEAGAAAAGYNTALAGGWDGGVPRHALLGYTAGGVSLDTQNRLSFSKVVEMARPVYFPETGTDLEKVSMAHHAKRDHPGPVMKLDGTVGLGNFVLNGAPPVPGAPFQDPCVDDARVPLTAGVLGQFFDGDNNPLTLGTQGSSFFSSDNPRTYKVANVQINAVFNKVGYHYPQERIIALWEDVDPTVLKQRPPEPLVMRFNTLDCGKILHANLVPLTFEVDDFQVRTPTDIIAQHIHLPKWDLTTNDGAANGWNYEDGSLAPGAVHERALAINKFNSLAGTVVGPNCTLAIVLANRAEEIDPVTGKAFCPIPGQFAPIDLTGLQAVATLPNACGENAVPGGPAYTDCGTLGGLTTLNDHVEHPFFKDLTNPQNAAGMYKSARTTIQRIFVDPIVNVAGRDRGLGMTFSHDHYGPSTFQQIGLYSTILAEPAGSAWKHNESGVQIGKAPDGTGGRDDGGPTTWQAAIITPNTKVGSNTLQSHLIPDHREFYFEMSDFQHAYEAGTYVGANEFGIPVETEIFQPDPFNATVAFAPAIQDTWRFVVNPSLKVRELGPTGVGNGGPDVVKAEPFCPGFGGDLAGTLRTPRPCAEAINIAHSSMFVVNFRNEPVGLRVFDPNAIGPDNRQGAQTAGPAGDLAFAFQSRQDRAIAALNTSVGNTPYPPVAPYCQGGVGDLINCDRRNGDPFTPIMRAYENDEVKVKIQVGATEEQHQATIHGMKWLSNGSGFGRSGNSGWRNFQSHGISEQFSLQIPINPDPNQTGNTVDYLYATDATRDGFWLGSWGILRSYGQARQDLFALPDNPQQGARTVVNQQNFAGVCPRVLDNRGRPGNQIANLRQYDVTAVLANNVLPNVAVAGGVTISPNTQITIGGVVVGGDSDGDGQGDNAGGPLNPLGGTLVYNRRGTVVPDVVIGAGAEAGTFPGGAGPLNDPTAILYVRTDDLQPIAGADTPQRRRDPAVPVRLRDTAPVEPLVLRANAGDCVQVTLRNRLPAAAPDLAGWQDMMWAVNRDLFQPVRGNEMHFFNNNLVRPSSHVGLHAQLVEYDASRDDGVLVGQNAAGNAGPVQPGGQKTYTWYAGDLRHERVEGGNPNQRQFRIVATPVEFGGTNLVSADRVKQPQKGLFGALVIEPQGACHPDSVQTATCTPPALDLVPDGQGTGTATRLTRAQATITAAAGDAGSGGTYREALAIGHKITNLRWKNGTAIANVKQNELGREGAEDSGHAGFNYGTEAPWFRFKLPPDVPFGNAQSPGTWGGIPNAHAHYANNLVAGEPNAIPANEAVSAAGDPQTPVFRATADTANANPRTDTRMYVLNGASADRDGAFILHGHVWQRDPHVCTGAAQDGTVALPGRCAPDTPVPSLALGDNRQGKWVGGQEGMGHVLGHWPILFDAGGTDRVTGDYLFRDYSPSGNQTGMFGILRVQ